MESGTVDAPEWELESLCAGGPGGDVFRGRVAALREALAAFRARLAAAPPIGADPGAWEALLAAHDGLHLELWELATFAGCSGAADAASPVARGAEAAVDDLSQQLQDAMVLVAAAVDAADDPAFEALAARADAASPWLRHLRAGRALRLSPELEALKTATDREGLVGWGRLYDLVQGTLEGELRGADGAVRRVSAAELLALRADPDPGVRKAAHEAREAAWRGVRDLCAHTLTQITGNRLQHNERRGVDELADTLHGNRLERRTLDAMWAAAEAARPSLARYLAHKARLLGQEKLAWHDLEAPVGKGADAAIGWDDAVGRIRRAFDGFHPDLGAFAGEAVARRWIDAKARPGRRPGGFCANAPRHDASRIFMTFSGTLDNATTLAHELGHAFHNRVLAGVPASRQHLTSALAETASTFGEAVFRARLLADAADDAERACYLEQQLSAAVAFLMNIPHRFAIERALYAMRADGVLDADALDALAVRAQREAHADALATWEPTFWSSKLHFFIPEFGFYNWPYTFGYLFSAALHQRAVAEGRDFYPKLRALLLRTGWQPTEALAHDTLGVDLGDPAFWRGIVAPLDGVVDAFVACAPAR